MSKLSSGTLQSMIIAMIVLSFQFPAQPSAAEEWLVKPYLQHPTQQGMTILWLSTCSSAGEVTIDQLPGQKWLSEVMAMPELDLSQDELKTLSLEPCPRFRHRVHIESLKPNQQYNYQVSHNNLSYSAEFQTAPEIDQTIRFIVYADSETEPESTGAHVDWPALHLGNKRPYLVDQTEGYRQNLKIISQQNPHFVAIVGDLVEKGGRQLDWDEFWKHNAGQYGNLSSRIPIFPAIGNHENYAGTDGGYSIEGARRSIAKYQAYFETPSNGAANPAFVDRYYRIDYGPISYITIDSSDGSPHATAADSNFMLKGEHDGGDAPDFNPGSTQYQWLESQLEDAYQKSRFIFVQFHHMPYSVGVHGLPAGEGTGFDNQTGQPLRVLSPLFEKYQVAAVFCGHDEIYEHAIVNGVHYFDVGMGGDGLRGPATGPDGNLKLPTTNPHQVFLAHLNSKEVWDGKRLVHGGKHYGHAEVNIFPNSDGWLAEICPVYIFPVMDADGKVVSFERRTYDDLTVIRSHKP